ncbi:helix-turn-helix domain-containing protein [Providencia vermicola]|uniref:Helix-turn-helix domain-containing protein n=1 Tax=Providencia vermicola TaxID=333965 RepID=A0AAX3RXX8_9GAMM|nr:MULTISPECIES: helix-turn-helix transcriptional regulator [Providencia]ELX8377893.1 helix-turn-helix transcriptional regulator [Providencia stuartii]EMD5257434.1 helix-turn-helix transcriptional regulator [Providencia stuartii]USB37405.1 helix-turn-helix domain-containing protein [Providencia vermicola]WFC06338.1 helix-turn-helix transcriptional regulator [Providencia vermicola]
MLLKINSRPLSESDKVAIKKEMAVIIGRVLFKLRKSYVISGKKLAKEVGMSQQQISRYENGINYITVDMILGILYFLEVPIFEFFNIVTKEIKNSNYELFLIYEKVLTNNYINSNLLHKDAFFDVISDSSVKYY